LRQGELDFVIGPLRSPAPYETLTEQHLYDELFAVVARAGHRLATREPSWGELGRCPQRNGDAALL
jgi:DNA-binding transcriptional LysR family regulator